MRLRGTDFRPVCNASGAQGFFGEGYPFHLLWKLARLTFKNCGFTAKSTGMEKRLSPEEGKGNMRLRRNKITPAAIKPSCIIVKFKSGTTLNAVGLSGPGLDYLLQLGHWQRRKGDPFHLSFASALATKDERLQELREFVQRLKPLVHSFNTDVGLELNPSCPNTGHDPSELLNEGGEMIEIAAELDVPLQLKTNVLAEVRTVCEILKHPACDALTMSNALPFGKRADRVPYKELFGSDTESPLARFKGGGLSGPYLFPLVCEWIEQAYQSGLRKPIWACGGINSVAAVQKLASLRAKGIQMGVQLGVVAITRPWRMPGIIRCANELFRS